LRALRLISILFVSLLLFVCLNGLAAAVTLDRTVLNAGFVISRLENLEMSAMLEEIITSGQNSELPPQVREAIAGTAVSMEPQIKTQAGYVVQAIYDYIKGSKDNPDLAEVFKNSLLGEEFLSAFVESSNIPVLASGIFEEQLKEAAPDDLEVSDNLPEAVVKALQENQESLEAQLKQAAGLTAEYLLGETQQFSIEFDVSGVPNSLRVHLHSSFMNSPPERLQGETAGVIEQEFNRLFAVFVAELPASIEIDQTAIGEDVPVQVAQSIEEIESGLEEARRLATAFRTVFVVMVLVVLFLAAAIVLIYREPAGATLNLGIVVVLAAVAVLTAGIAGRSIVTQFIVQAGEAPEQVLEWLFQLAHSAFLPFIVTGILYLAAGAVLLLAWLFLRQRMQA